MLYIVGIVGGLVCGALVPKTSKALTALFAAGIGFLTIVVIIAALASYNTQAIRNVLTLTDTPATDSLGLIQLATVAYALLIGGVVAGVRYFFGRHRANT